MKRAYLALTLFLAACGGGGGGHAGVPAVPVVSGTSVPAQSTPEPNVSPACTPLNQLPKGTATCFALVRTNGAGAPQGYRTPSLASARGMVSTPTGMNGDPLGPVQLQGAYNLPAASAGQGQTVAIVDAYDNANLESDLAAYRAQFNLPPCTTANGCLKIRNEEGNAWPLPANDEGWGLEEDLDVDMVSAICPNCNIDVVVADSATFPDLEKAENAAVALGAKYVSNSYGGSEGGSPSNPAFDSHPGVVIAAATGDSSWFAGVNMPAAYENVVAVGGTTLYPYNNGRGWLEVAWSGSGSGCSQVVPRPSYQSRVGCQQTGFDGKALADVSALADPWPGVWVSDTAVFGGWTIVGGTSAATPIVTAAYALAANPLSVGPGAASIWNDGGRASLNDITLGNNGFVCTPLLICQAGAGYDGPSGWGTPNGLGAL